MRFTRFGLQEPCRDGNECVLDEIQIEEMKEQPKENNEVLQTYQSIRSSQFGECYDQIIFDDFEGSMVIPTPKPELICDDIEIIDLNDDYRCPSAYKNGGFALTDQAVINKFRSAFKNLIAQIGRQLIQGKFNLTKTSFPIKCMSQDTILQVIGSVASPCCPYFNAASKTSDPIERMKYVIVASFGYLYPCHTWDKPLNPIIGETYQATMGDGTNIFLEQISHHPPISYVLVEGPG